MCCKKSRNGWSLALLFFFALAPWPLFSQSPASTVGSSEPSNDSLVKEFLAAAAEIVKKYPETKPQLLKMADVLTILSERSEAKSTQLENQATILSAQVATLQAEIKTLKDLRTDSEKLQNNLISDLKTEINNWRTAFTISVIGNGVQLIFNIGQALNNR